MGAFFKGKGDGDKGDKGERGAPVESGPGEGPRDDAPPCGEQDWDCIDKWASENEDKLPCKLKDDDKCWWDFLEANPPCKEEDEECRKSFKRHYLEGKGGDDLPAPEGPPCGDQDFECWKRWGSENPEKLPCKIDGSDDDCWERVLKEDPPCADDDEDCWKHFMEVFGDGKRDDQPCGDQDFECWKRWGSENPEKLPCKIDGTDDECWEGVLREDPPCADDDEECW